MGAECVLHELGDGAVVDALIYCTYTAAWGGCNDVYARLFASVYDDWGEKSAYIDWSGNVMVFCFLLTSI